MNIMQGQVQRAQTYLNRMSKKIQFKYVFIGALVLGIAVAGYFGYRYIIARNTRAAQLVFAEGLEAFTTMSQAKPNDRKWQEVATTFDEAYKRYPRTAFSPAMLAYKAQALVFDNQLAAAVDVMQTVVSSLRKSSPLYYPYKTKLALLKHDSSDKVLQETGAQELDALAKTIQNPVQDWAQYYLGYFAMLDGDSTRAQAVWNELISQHEKSAWTTLARKQLALISDATNASIPSAPEKTASQTPTSQTIEPVKTSRASQPSTMQTSQASQVPQTSQVSQAT